MHTKDYLEILTFVCSIAAVVVVGRSNIKKQVISDLQALVMTHEQNISQLKDELLRKDKRICALEDTIDGYAEMVREGDFLGGHGARSRNRAASAKAAKNREV